MILLLLLTATRADSKPNGRGNIYQDPTLPFPQRAKDLVSHLTLQEKAAQLGHFAADTNQSLGRASSPAVARVGLAAYNYGTECNTGIIVGFPQNIGMAATFNRDLVFHAGRATGLGIRAKRLEFNSTTPPHSDKGSDYPALSCWSPMINIMRHPLWGRNHEGYGADPFLAGEMAYSVVRGMQGDDAKYLLMNAGVKHFAGFDGPGNGGNAVISDADWFQTYLPPFVRAFQAGAKSTMCTYAQLDGIFGCENPKLLQSWLRDETGFEGYVISDQGAIHDSASSLNAGCDLADGSEYQDLAVDVAKGRVNESTLDVALARVLAVRFGHGEFDPPELVPYQDKSKYGLEAYDKMYFGNVSCNAARQSLTLLKNRGALPLDAVGTPSVAVIGLERNQDAGYNTAPGVYLQRYTSDWLQEFGFNTTFSQGCLDGPACKNYDSIAVKAASRSVSVAVIFIGNGGFFGEGHDMPDMSLLGNQTQMVQDVLDSDAGSVVLVLHTGNPVNLTAFADNDRVSAILHAFYPQFCGGLAVAEALAGVFSPAGRMPYSWVKDLSLSGDLSNYTMAGTKKTYRYRSEADTNRTVLWSFGYGLSYTHFRYSDLSVEPAAPRPCDNITVTVSVENLGAVGSDEVVQVYASWQLPDRQAVLATPRRQLVGFQRVYVPAGATKIVSIVIPPGAQAVLNASGTFVPTIDPSKPSIRPCDGNTTNGDCGTIRGADFFVTGKGNLGGVKANTTDQCCAACKSRDGSLPGDNRVCKTWTLVGEDCEAKGGCLCWLHLNMSGFHSGAGAITSGVVFSRLPRFPSCPPKHPGAGAFPKWTLVPGVVNLDVGGQQPRQPTSASSNVLSGSFVIQGDPTLLSHCT